MELPFDPEIALLGLYPKSPETPESILVLQAPWCIIITTQLCCHCSKAAIGKICLNGSRCAPINSIHKNKWQASGPHNFGSKRANKHNFVLFKKNFRFFKKNPLQQQKQFHKGLSDHMLFPFLTTDGQPFPGKGHLSLGVPCSEIKTSDLLLTHLQGRKNKNHTRPGQKVSGPEEGFLPRSLSIPCHTLSSSAFCHDLATV